MAIDRTSFELQRVPANGAPHAVCTSCNREFRSPAHVPNEWQCACLGLVVKYQPRFHAGERVSYIHYGEKRVGRVIYQVGRTIGVRDLRELNNPPLYQTPMNVHESALQPDHAPAVRTGRLMT